MTDNIEAIFPLSPTQQGMLFHSLYAPGDAVYHNQIHYRIDGPLDAEAFRHAWQTAVDRHAALRTLFTWEKRERPLQVVNRRARLAWHAEDWRDLAVPQQQAKLARFLEADRAQPFDLGKAPLFRAAIFRLGESSHEFVCAHHHLVLDGWSAVLLTSEVVQAYEGRPSPSSPPPFEEYVAWVRAQDGESAKTFWLQELAGISRPTPLPAATGSADEAPSGFGEVTIDVPADVTSAAHAFVRQQRLTLNSVVQAAWALVLGRASGDDSVVFGTTVSGRPPALRDVDRMIGCFINTLPVVVRTGDGQDLLAWLRDLMLRQLERERFAYCGLGDIQRWVTRPARSPLFESIVVVENHTPAAAADGGTPTLRIGPMRPIERTNFPLTLVVDAGLRIGLTLLYHEPRYTAVTAARLGDRLVAVLASIVGAAGGHVGDLPRSADERAIQETAAIGALLREHPAIREAAIATRPGPDGAPQRVAYIVPAGAAPSPAVLRAFLRGRLADAEVPSAFAVRDAIPRTPGGALDIDALEVPVASSQPQGAVGYVAPRNVEEELLAEIWGDVLGRDRVGIHDDYFELGGDSIRGISIVARARKIGVDLTLQHLFELRTIAATMTARRPAEVPADRDAPARFALLSHEDRARMPADVEDAYPLAALQAGMLYHALMSPGGSLYHNVSSYRLRARFDERALRDALAWVAARHPILRTGFDLATYSEALQLVRRDVPISLVVEDISHLSDAQRQAIVAERFELEKGHAFDVTTAPLWRFRVHAIDQDTFQLTLTEHHAIIDGWSVASLVSELLQRYYVVLGLSTAALPPAPSMRYAEFVAEERRAIASRESREFWRGQLRDLPPSEVKGAAAAYPSSPNPQPLVHAAVTPAISAGLKRVAKKAGVPLKSVLLGIHLRALQALVGERRVATGVVSNGRLEATDGDRVLGLFLNSLPFVMNLGGGRWLDLFKAVFKHESAMLAHRRFPLAEIQRELGGAAPFDTTFNFMHFHAYADALALNGLDVLDATFYERANFALAADFGLDPKTGDLRLGFDYDPARLTDTQVAAIAAGYVALMAAVADDPSRSYADAAILPASARRQLEAWNHTALDVPPLSVHEIVERHAADDPDRVALVCGAEQLTYGEANARANRLAHRLRAEGVGPDARVAICLDRSPEMAIALLAVMKAGGAYVPLDPSWPRERLRLILEDARPQALVSRERERGQVADFEGPAVLLDRDADALLAEPDGDPAAIGGPAHLAYVIYTSGSTGRPKGVAVPHAALTNFLRTMSLTPGLDRDDTLLAVTTISFDIAGLELYLPLVQGARLVIATREEAADGARLVTLLDEHDATVMQATPSTWRLLVAAGWTGAPLKILCGGEALPRPLAAQLIDRGRELWNVYGPTETTIWSTAYRVDAGVRAPDRNEQAVSIGRPIGNTRIHVTDCHQQPVPIGHRGELLIGGDGLARGYLSRPALTAAVFVPDPSVGCAGARLYRTGDVVAYQRDGSLLFMGRRDHQIKLRGYRIELGEIEAVLAAHPAVREAAVVIDKGGEGQERLVAYLVTGAGGPTREALRAHVASALPDYMVPAIWVALAELPRTPNGKIDRRALPSPKDAPLAARETRAVPRGETEQLVAQAWRESLNVDDLALDDNFFDVGGHSLLLIRLHEKLKRQFPAPLQLVDLFRHPTIRAQALFLGETGAVAAPAPGLQDRADRQRAGFQKLSRLAATRRPS
jgi:amino acid adenylation domain-containing protein